MLIYLTGILLLASQSASDYLWERMNLLNGYWLASRITEVSSNRDQRLQDQKPSPKKL